MSSKPKTSKASHLLAPAAVLAVVLLMIVPLPPLFLDLLLSIDIGLAVVLLLTAIYVKRPTEFSVFPSLLLLLTLIRLSLNIASTRLVLMHGQDGTEAAGAVIQSFGQFVIGGNFVVGVVVFLVLIAIQFLVINHGAVRISEVTARFTLDAMPGRQMAIDADLNAGLIDEKEARDRRDRVRREADFYGAMDGAIRFTQRDAMAALLITGVNIAAGLVIGVLQHGLDISTAATTYTLLTVGEGLVTAIPALLVSMSGGLITTRAASESNLGEEVALQLLARPRPLGVAAGVLVLLAMIPGLPKFAFLSVAGVLALAAYSVRTSDEAPVEEAAAPLPSDAPEAAVAAVDPISVEVGYALVSIVDEKQGGTLLTTRTLDGVQTKEPAFGLPATWVGNDQREVAAAAGYTVVDATTALSTHLSETIRTFLPDLLSRQQVKDMLDRVGETAPKLVEDLVPKLVSLGDVQRVLRQLLRERVPVRDLVTILEAVADAASITKDPDTVTEAVRSAMGRAICKPYQNDRGELSVIGVAPSLEERLMASLVKTEQGAMLAVDPQQAQSIASRIARALEQAVAQPVLLCSPALRPHLHRMFSRVLPHLGVLSHAEVPPHIQVVPVTTLD
jgi:flagellar biosynthesis protein FlhA